MKKRRVPDYSLCVEAVYLDIDQMRSTFTELATLLLGDAKQAKSFYDQGKVELPEEVEDSWWNFYEELLSKGYAVELDCKCELEDFIYHVQKLIRNKSLDTRENLTIDTAALDEDQVIMDWCASLNSTWENHTLAGMDIGTDSFVPLVLLKMRNSK